MPRKITLQYRGFTANVEFCREDQCWYGMVEGTSDCIGFIAEDSDEIEQGFYNTVDDYLDFCREIGKNPWREIVLKPWSVVNG